MMIRHLLLVISLIFISTTCFATTYYIDYDTGIDTNAGTSTSTPFKHCPDDSLATDTASTTTLVAGDTIIFKGGVTYTGAGTGTLFTINVSGTIGNYITYRGNTVAGDWGSGKAIIDLDSNYYHAFKATTKSYIKILNFKIPNAKNVRSTQNATVDISGVVTTGVNYLGNGLTASYGVMYFYGCDNFLIKDVEIYEIENWEHRSVLGAEADGDPDTIQNPPCDQQVINCVNDCTNIDVEDCSFWATGEGGVFFNSGHSFSMKGCKWGGESDNTEAKWWSVALRITNNAYDVLVENNTFHGGWYYVGDESSPRSHATDTLHLWGDVSYVTVTKNLFYNDHNFSYARGTCQLLCVEDVSDHIYIMNNLGINLFSLRTIYLDVDAGSDYYWIENNTFVQWDRPLSAVSTISIGSLVGSNLTIQNNVFYSEDDYGSAIIDSRTSFSGISNNNCYYYPNTDPFKLNGTKLDFATWKTTTSQDSKSIETDPLLANIPNEGLTSSSGDYQAISSISPIIDAGITINTFEGDYIGTIRPKGTAWDIGAYEYIHTKAYTGKNALIPFYK